MEVVNEVIDVDYIRSFIVICFEVEFDVGDSLVLNVIFDFLFDEIEWFWILKVKFNVFVGEVIFFEVVLEN